MKAKILIVLIFVFFFFRCFCLQLNLISDSVLNNRGIYSALLWIYIPEGEIVLKNDITLFLGAPFCEIVKYEIIGESESIYSYLLQREIKVYSNGFKVALEFKFSPECIEKVDFIPLYFSCFILNDLKKELIPAQLFAALSLPEKKNEKRKNIKSSKQKSLFSELFNYETNLGKKFFEEGDALRKKINSFFAFLYSNLFNIILFLFVLFFLLNFSFELLSGKNYSWWRKLKYQFFWYLLLFIMPLLINIFFRWQLGI